MPAILTFELPEATQHLPAIPLLCSLIPSSINTAILRCILPLMTVGSRCALESTLKAIKRRLSQKDISHDWHALQEQTPGTASEPSHSDSNSLHQVFARYPHLPCTTCCCGDYYIFAYALRISNSPPDAYVGITLSNGKQGKAPSAATLCIYALCKSVSEQFLVLSMSPQVQCCLMPDIPYS